METSWRPVGDSSLHGSRRRRRDVSWSFGGSRGSRGEIKHVRFFMRLFGDFFKSPVGLGDVAATRYVFEEEDVLATSPRPARDKMIEENLRRRLRNATRRRRLRDDD